MHFTSEKAASGKEVSPGPRAVSAAEAGLARVAAWQMEGNPLSVLRDRRAGYMTGWVLLKMIS